MIEFVLRRDNDARDTWGADRLRTTAVKDGQDMEHAAVYPNYALFDTPLEDLYGKNVPRLHAARWAIDPDDVMGLAGGFKL